MLLEVSKTKTVEVLAEINDGGLVVMTGDGVVGCIGVTPGIGVILVYGVPIPTAANAFRI